MLLSFKTVQAFMNSWNLVHYRRHLINKVFCHLSEMLIVPIVLVLSKVKIVSEWFEIKYKLGPRDWMGGRGLCEIVMLGLLRLLMLLMLLMLIRVYFKKLLSLGLRGSLVVSCLVHLWLLDSQRRKWNLVLHLLNWLDLLMLTGLRVSNNFLL